MKKLNQNICRNKRLNRKYKRKKSINKKAKVNADVKNIQRRVRHWMKPMNKEKDK